MHRESWKVLTQALLHMNIVNSSLWSRSGEWGYERMNISWHFFKMSRVLARMFTFFVVAHYTLVICLCKHVYIKDYWCSKSLCRYMIIVLYNYTSFLHSNQETLDLENIHYTRSLIGISSWSARVAFKVARSYVTYWFDKVSFIESTDLSHCRTFF